MQNQARLLQAQGRLLDTTLLKRYYKRDGTHRNLNGYAELLATPCTAIREMVLDMPLHLMFPGKDSMDFVPFPLARRATENASAISDWPEFVLRHNACIINEAYVSLEKQCIDALEWHCRQSGPSRLPDTSVERLASMPAVRWIRVDRARGPEPEPASVVTNDSLSSSEIWLRCEFKFDQHAIQSAWNRTMTPHTVLMLFFCDKEPKRHYVLLAYTVPSAQETATSTGPVAIENDLLQNVNRSISVRISPTYYRMICKKGGSIERGSFDYLDAVTSETDVITMMDTMGVCGSTMHAIRLDGVLMQEYSMSSLMAMPLNKGVALMAPEKQAWSLNWDSSLSVDAADAIFDDFGNVIRRYIQYPLAPQQQRYCLTWILHLWKITLGETKTPFTMGALAGPPGTGKTATIMTALLLSRLPDVLRKTFTLVSLHSGQPIAEDQVAGLVERVLALRIVYTAPTNQAVDTGTTMLSQIVEYCARSEPTISVTLRVVRNCDFEKIADRPDVLPLHSRLQGASRLKEQLYEEEDKINASFRSHYTNEAWRRHDKDRARMDWIVRYQRVWHRKDPISAQAEREWDRTIDRRFPVLTEDERENLNRRLNSLRSDVRKLRDFQRDPRGHPLVFRLAQQCDGFEGVIQDNPANVCCFTAGYVNPYHNRPSPIHPGITLSPCTGSVVILDEASQCSFPHLLVLVKEASSLVMCGDTAQLGAVLKGPMHGNMDLKQPLMARMVESTIPLTLCWRLPVEMTRFLSERVYSEAGLYSQTGQNIIRSSPLHNHKLFPPTVIIDIRDSIAYRPAGSTSKINDEEARAVHVYLNMFSNTMHCYHQDPIKAALVSPFTAQAGILQAIADDYAGDPIFASITAGTIESIQGVTTDLCICSATMAGSPESSRVKADFLTDERLNVAISRAKTHCVMVCDVEALQRGLAGQPDHLIHAFLAHFPIIQLDRRWDDMALDTFKAATRRNTAAAMLAVDIITPCTAPYSPSQSKLRDPGEPYDKEQLRNTLEQAMQMFSDNLDRMAG